MSHLVRFCEGIAKTLSEALSTAVRPSTTRPSVCNPSGCSPTSRNRATRCRRSCPASPPHLTVLFCPPLQGARAHAARDQILAASEASVLAERHTAPPRPAARRWRCDLGGGRYDHHKWAPSRRAGVSLRRAVAPRLSLSMPRPQAAKDKTSGGRPSAGILLTPEAGSVSVDFY